MYLLSWRGPHDVRAPCAGTAQPREGDGSCLICQIQPMYDPPNIRISRVVSLWPPRYVRASSARGDTLDRKMRPSKHPDGAGNVGPRKMLSSSQTILLD